MNMKQKKASKINVDYLNRCVRALESAYKKMKEKPLDLDSDDISYEIYRAACIKEFEIILEQSGKLLRKRLRAWFSSHQEADRLTFKDLFRYSAKHGLMDVQQSERWIGYRDNRNNIVHDYGEGFAEETLKILPDFISDAKTLVKVLKSAEEET